MSSLTPLSWQKLICVFGQIGYTMTGQKGRHVKMEKAGTPRPLIIPRYSDIDPDVTRNLIRTAGILHEAFLALLEHC